MREEKQTIVLDNTSNPKNAALFFGDVIPNPFGVAESYYNGEISSHQLKPIFPPQFQESEEYTKFWNKVYHTGKLLKVSRKLGEADAPEWLLTLDRLLACSLEHMSYIKGKFAPGTLVYLYS